MPDGAAAMTDHEEQVRFVLKRHHNATKGRIHDAWYVDKKYRVHREVL